MCEQFHVHPVSCIAIATAKYGSTPKSIEYLAKDSPFPDRSEDNTLFNLSDNSSIVRLSYTSILSGSVGSSTVISSCFCVSSFDIKSTLTNSSVYTAGLYSSSVYTIFFFYQVLYYNKLY